MKTSGLSEDFTTSKKIQIITEIIENISRKWNKVKSFCHISKSVCKLECVHHIEIFFPSFFHPGHILYFYGQGIESRIDSVDIVDDSPEKYLVSEIFKSIKTFQKSMHPCQTIT